MHAVETEKLTKYYGKNRGIVDVSLSVMDGEIFGIIGPRGAGKTTIIRLLVGLIKPNSGEVKLFGKNLPPAGGKLYRRVGYLPAEVNYYPDMTGRDLLDYTAGFYKGSDYKWGRELVERLQFDPDLKLGVSSHSNRKKLGIIQALLHKPLLLIIDEPGNSLDPLIKKELFKILEELNQLGTTIFFSTHTLEEVERICHRVALINEGDLIYLGLLNELPGRHLRSITMKIAGRQPSSVALEKLGEAKELSSRPGYYVVFSRLPANELVAYLSHFDLEYLNIANPSLEEIYFDLHRATTGGGDNSNV